MTALPAFEDLAELARAHGVDHLGVAPAAVMERARAVLHARKAAGLHADMQFTYRNPDRSTDPQRILPGARSILVGARAYGPARHEGAVPSGAARVARYARVDPYGPLRAALGEVARELTAVGERAVVLADDNAIVDRAAAELAGVGWFGKNANLLVPGVGSMVVLGCVVTTADYPPSVPVPEGCGPCRRCLDLCPTGAIVAPGVVDAGRCLAWLAQRGGSFPVEFRAALGDRLYGCDTCQEVCPPTLGPVRGDVAEPTGTVALTAVLSDSDADLLARHGHWYLAGRDPRWWRRNALVVIGNTASSADAWAVELLDRYAAGPDELLAEHARWARRRIAEREGR